MGSEELNDRDEYGYTLLHYAAKYGHLDMIEKLIKMKPSKYIIIYYLSLVTCEHGTN